MMRGALGRVGRDGLLEDELLGLGVAEVVPEEMVNGNFKLLLAENYF